MTSQFAFVSRSGRSSLRSGMSSLRSGMSRSHVCAAGFRYVKNTYKMHPMVKRNIISTTMSSDRKRIVSDAALAFMNAGVDNFSKIGFMSKEGRVPLLLSACAFYRRHTEDIRGRMSLVDLFMMKGATVIGAQSGRSLGPGDMVSAPEMRFLCARYLSLKLVASICAVVGGGIDTLPDFVAKELKKQEDMVEKHMRNIGNESPLEAAVFDWRLVLMHIRYERFLRAKASDHLPIREIFHKLACFVNAHRRDKLGTFGNVSFVKTSAVVNEYRTELLNTFVLAHELGFLKELNPIPQAELLVDYSVACHMPEEMKRKYPLIRDVVLKEAGPTDMGALNEWAQGCSDKEKISVMLRARIDELSSLQSGRVKLEKIGELIRALKLSLKLVGKGSKKKTPVAVAALKPLADVVLESALLATPECPVCFLDLSAMNIMYYTCCMRSKSGPFHVTCNTCVRGMCPLCMHSPVEAVTTKAVVEILGGDK
jgi:hypothetical protein